MPYRISSFNLSNEPSCPKGGAGSSSNLNSLRSKLLLIALNRFIVFGDRFTGGIGEEGTGVDLPLMSS